MNIKTRLKKYYDNKYRDVKPLVILEADNLASHFLIKGEVRESLLKMARSEQSDLKLLAKELVKAKINKHLKK